MADTIVYEGDTELQHYQVVDTIYEGRSARVLFSGQRGAAQSGIAKDGQPDLLFDYNQRYMELLEGLEPQRVLLIGGGAYTLPMALLAALPNVRIDVIELDKGLDVIARRYFDLQDNQRLRIFHGDGRYYLEEGKQVYDAILIDAFTHTTVPESLSDKQVPTLIWHRLTSEGIVAVNLISPYLGPHAGLIHSQVAYYNDVFPKVGVYPAGRTLFTLQLPQNLLLVGQKNQNTPLQLRYGALESTLPSQ